MSIRRWKHISLCKLILKKSLMKANRVIAISESVKQSLLSVFNTLNDKISIIYNGVNIKISATKQCQPNNPVEIIYVGGLITNYNDFSIKDKMIDYKNVNLVIDLERNKSLQILLELLSKWEKNK